MNPLNPEEFRRQGHMVIDFLADYYKNIEQYPVRSQVQPGYLLESLPDCAPLHPESIETILKDVHREIIPGITHWQSPSFFAYFASSGSTASFVGEMLLNGFNVVGFNWLSSPAATELETLVIEWLSKLLQLPKSFSSSSNSGGGGVLQGTTCEAFVCTLLAAREKMLDQIGRENSKKLVVYCSDQTHCSLQKAAKIVGIDPENIRQVLTTMSTNFQLSAESLDELIKKDVEVGLVPMYLCATVGTTSTTAVDPLGPLCEVASTYNLWVHVDAAYAGSACICPEFRHFLDGVEGASSFSFNAHKWLLTNLACCCLWMKDTLTLTKSLSTNPEYLNNKATESLQVVDFKDWQIALTRRFQALKLWMVLRSYGTTGLRAFIRNHVKMAKDFEGMVSMDNRFEIIVPRNFSMVCFRVSPFAISQQGRNHHEANGNAISQHGDNDHEADGTVISQQGDNDHEANGTAFSQNSDNDHEANGTAISQKGDNDYEANGTMINQNGYNEVNGTAINQQGDNDHEANEFNMKLLESINETGRVYMTHSIVGGIYFIRFAVGATLTEDRHVQMAWELVQDQASSLLHTRTPKSIR